MRFIKNISTHVQIENTSIFIKEMFEKRLIFVNDILNTDSELMSYRQLIEMCGPVASVQECNQLLSASPQR